MTLAELMHEYRVHVISRLNDEGLVKIGEFRSYELARLFEQEVGKITNCHLPAYNPIHPPRETRPEYRHMNERADKHASFTISVNIGKDSSTFRALPPIYQR